VHDHNPGLSAGKECVAFAAQTALAAITVSGLEAVAFGLMPFRFMPGVAIYRWNRAIWAALFGASRPSPVAEGEG
jgi:hypothetical protein